MMGTANAREIAGLICTKYPNDRVADLNFYYPQYPHTTHKRTEAIRKLIETAPTTTKENFEKTLYKYLFLLM